MKKDSLWPAVTFIVLYTALLFGGWAWMLHAHTKQIKAEITPIKEALTNHITSTNKKIEQLTNRFDKLSDRFDRLYELLLKDKQNESAKQQQKH